MVLTILHGAVSAINSSLSAAARSPTHPVTNRRSSVCG